jgi:hypothetical protein
MISGSLFTRGDPEYRFRPILRRMNAPAYPACARIPRGDISDEMNRSETPNPPFPIKMIIAPDLKAFGVCGEADARVARKLAEFPNLCR